MSKENKNNYCVIMAGGVGSRFWPYSRNKKPKQFLDFFGTGKSLLQMTVDRFLPVVPMENILIVTNVLYRDLVLEQLPAMKAEQVLCEPARRNTAPCIAWAADAIAKRVGNVDAKDIRIVVAPSDHLILDNAEFVRVVEKGLAFVGEKDALLTLGMKPTRPETGYGYIQFVADELDIEDCRLKSEESGICSVKTFTEKPNLEMAKTFLASGEFLWNAGIFLWNLKAIREAFKKYLPDVAEVFEKGLPFESCPSISIDYGVMEKADNVYVLPADFGWSDLGTWGSLYALSEKDEAQNVSLHSEAMFYESTGNIVTLEKGKLAVVQGVNDLIIAEADNVLLVCKKEDEQRIKDFVNEVKPDYR